jgi:hypothetical protein
MLSKLQSTQQFLTFLFIFLTVCLVIAYPYRRTIKHKLKEILGYPYKDSFRGSGNCLGCSEVFTDNVKSHALAYANEGIEPQPNDKAIDKLFKSTTLLEIKTDSLYIVRKLQYSKPYILPKGLVFINELAKLYYFKCKSDSVKYIPFTISSVTRSMESVEKLMNNNSNSIENSAHLKGKTFDISYRAFNDNKSQINLFIEALKELRKENKCYVKFEQNGCLHITAI